MGKIILFFALILFIGLGGGAVLLATWDIPAPTQSVERTLSDDRFPR